MTISATNAFFSRPTFYDDETTETQFSELLFQGLSQEEGDLQQEESIQNPSVTVDCLRVPIQYLLLETLNEANESDADGLYALAQNIFQFSIVYRHKIYDCLELAENEKDDLEDFYHVDQIKFQNILKNYIRSFSEKKTLNSEDNFLVQLSKLLKINLVVLKQEKNKIEIIEDHFFTSEYDEGDHKCFQSQLCIAIAEKKGLFKKSEHEKFKVECSGQSASKIREVYAEFAQVRRTILAIHNQQKTLEDLCNDSYSLWYEKHIQEGKLDVEAALIDIFQSEINIQDFSENVLKQELRNYPLAVIREQPHKDSSLQEERHDFTSEGVKYAIKRTRGDGACALHAMLGEEINREYRLAGTDQDAGARAKSGFTDQLIVELEAENPIIINAFIEVINSLIRGTLSDPSSILLFGQFEEGRQLKSRWDTLQHINNQNLENLKNQEAALWHSLVSPSSSILRLIMQEVEEVTRRGVSTNPFYNKDSNQTVRLLNEQPKLILNFINAQPDEFLHSLSSEWRERMQGIRARQQDLLTALKAEEKAFILQQKMITQYVKILNRAEYYLNTQEIRVVAHLFDKKVQVVASIAGGIERSEELINRNGSGDLVMIHHHGIHFERCIPVKDSSFESGLQPATNKKLKKYYGVDLIKLNDSSLVTYTTISLIKALDNTLDFMEHKKLDDPLFFTLYGDCSREEVSKKYDEVLSGLIQSLGIQENWSLNDEGISEKIHSLIRHLHSQLPKGLKGHRSYLLDPRFEKLREIKSFIEKKKYIEGLAKEIQGQNLKTIKDVLRKTDKFSDLDESTDIPHWV